MKTWLIILSVAVVLLAAGTGVGFWMLIDAMAEPTDIGAELTDIKADLTNIETELTGTQEKLEENFGYWWDESAGESYWWGRVDYPWVKKTAEETIHDLQLTVEELEGTVQSLQWTVRDLEDAVQDLEWQLEWQS
jgi:hypothetical protein